MPYRTMRLASSSGCDSSGCDRSAWTAFVVNEKSRIARPSPQLVTSPLTCSVAASVFDAAFALSALASEAEVPELNTLKTMMDRLTDTRGRDLMLHEGELSAAAMEELRRLNRELLTLAASNWADWKSTLAVDVLQSDEFENMTAFIQELIRFSISHPLWHATDANLVMPLVSFFFDIASLLDPERLFASEHAVPRTSAAALHLASALSLEASPAQRAPQLNLYRITRAFQAWRPNRSTTSSVEAMLISYIDEFICTASARGLPTNGHGCDKDLATKLTVSFTHICRDHGVVSQHTQFARRRARLSPTGVPVHAVADVRFFAEIAELSGWTTLLSTGRSLTRSTSMLRVTSCWSR